MDRVDLDAAARKVRAWMLAHPGGAPAQMAEELQGEYGQHAEAMAIVLRGIMARYTNHPGELVAPTPAREGVPPPPCPG